ncbi:MAG: sensor histidine kinase [Myxococcota bacterium]
MSHESVHAEAEQRALAAQSARASLGGAKARLMALGVFLPILVALHLLGFSGWGDAILPLAAAFGIHGALYAARHHRLAARVLPFLFFVDVAIIFEVVTRLMPGSPWPTALATFSVGLFAVVVVMASTTMDRRVIWATALGASAAVFGVMRIAGNPHDTTLPAVAVVLLIAGVQTGLIKQLRNMVRELASTEVDWRVANDRVEELTRARDTIEQLLGEQRAHNDELRRLQTDKEALAALLVHDLRAPLGSLRANLDWARSELPPETDAEVATSLLDASTEAIRLGSMINDLLDITRLESGSFPLDRQPGVAEETLDAVVRHLGAQARARRVKLVLEPPPRVFLDVDHPLLRRALENLVSNALRYTPAEGTVRLEGRVRGEAFEFVVRNEGPSISPDARATLFDKFVQAGNRAENRRAGWGLGLYFCKLCVDAHGGSISLEDAPGWGASFVVQLPRALDTKAAA